MSESEMTKAKPFHITPSDDNTYYFFGAKAVLLASGKDTNGEYATVKLYQHPHSGPPMHVHEAEDEAFYILKGTVSFFVGDSEITATAGDHVFAPRGIPHTFKIGDEPAEFLVTATPAGFDDYVKELGIPVVKDAPMPDPIVEEPTSEEFQKIAEISAKYKVFYL